MRTSMSRRNKMISFRLSAEEYDAYREACERAGMRSISELARAGLQQFSSVTGRAGMNHELSNLRHRIQFLTLELDRITEEMRRKHPAENGYSHQEQV